MKLLDKEPVMAFATLIAVGLGIVGIIADANTVYIVLSAVLPIIAGIFQRQQVTPVASLPPVVAVETKNE